MRPKGRSISMQNNLFFSLTLNISLLVLMATILTEVRPLRMILKR